MLLPPTPANTVTQHLAHESLSKTTSQRKRELPEQIKIRPLGRVPKSLEHIHTFPEPHRSMWELANVTEQLNLVKVIDYVPAKAITPSEGAKPMREVVVMVEKTEPDKDNKPYVTKMKIRRTHNGSKSVDGYDHLREGSQNVDATTRRTASIRRPVFWKL